MEEFFIWLKTYEDPIQSVSIIIGFISLIVGFFVTFHTLRKDAKTRQLGYWLNFTQQHRDIWKMHLEHPGLSRIHSSKADLIQQPVTEEEHHFVSLLVHHLSAVQKTTAAGMFVAPQGLQRDIEGFFALPVPRAVWQKVRHLHDEEFVKFVESCLDAV